MNTEVILGLVRQSTYWGGLVTGRTIGHPGTLTRPAVGIIARPATPIRSYGVCTGEVIKQPSPCLTTRRTRIPSCQPATRRWSLHLRILGNPSSASKPGRWGEGRTSPRCGQAGGLSCFGRSSAPKAHRIPRKTAHPSEFAMTIRGFGMCSMHPEPPAGATSRATAR